MLDYWGERAYQRPARLYSHDVNAGNYIGGLERNSHYRECCKLLWKALCDGVFEALVRKGDSEPERIPPDSWLSVPRKDLRINFIQGKAFAGWEHDSPLRPLDGGVFIFEIASVKEWLSGLNSEHLLPTPLQRNPSCINGEPSVTQCEAIHWLANGFPRIASEAQLRCLEDAHFADEKLNESRLRELGDWNFERIEIEDFVAWQMAETVRINRVRKLLRDRIANGEMEAFGCFVDSIGLENGLSKVDPDFFLHAVELSSLHDLIGADEAAAGNAYREAREAGVWKAVRFRRSDLLDAWGDTESAVGTPNAGNAVKKVLLKRGPKGKWDWVGAKAEFDRLMAENGALSDTDPDWCKQAQVEAAITAWFADRLRGEAPSESWLRTKVSLWLQAFDEGR